MGEGERKLIWESLSSESSAGQSSRVLTDGPQDADVTHLEGGGTQAGLNLEITSHCQDTPVKFFPLSKHM